MNKIIVSKTIIARKTVINITLLFLLKNFFFSEKVWHFRGQIAYQTFVTEVFSCELIFLRTKNNNLKTYTIGFTPRLKKVIENSFNESKKLDSDYIGTEHLLIGIIKESDSIAGRILYDLGIDINKLYKQLVKLHNFDRRMIQRRLL